MDNLANKTITVSRGFTYAYYVTAPRSGSQHVPFLFQHGWPDSHSVWMRLLPYLRSLPNPIVVVDMLGFGESDKPVEVEALAYDAIAHDMTEILEAEGIDRVISVGHDHGSIPAQRLYNFHPDRVAAIILFNIDYTLPNKTGPPFNIQAFNDWATSRFGYPVYEYWNFFATDPEAAELMNQNIERVWDACHSTDMKELFCTKGAWKAYLQNPHSARVRVKSYALDPDLKDSWIRTMSSGGFEIPLNWYRAVVQDVQRKAEQKVRDADVVVRVPLLFIGATQDPVCRDDFVDFDALTPFIPDYTRRLVDAGHWPMLESPELVGSVIHEFLQAKSL